MRCAIVVFQDNWEKCVFFDTIIREFPPLNQNKTKTTRPTSTDDCRPHDCFWNTDYGYNFGYLGRGVPAKVDGIRQPSAAIPAAALHIISRKANSQSSAVMKGSPV